MTYRRGRMPTRLPHRWMIGVAAGVYAGNPADLLGIFVGARVFGDVAGAVNNRESCGQARRAGQGATLADVVCRCAVWRGGGAKRRVPACRGGRVGPRWGVSA